MGSFKDELKNITDRQLAKTENKKDAEYARNIIKRNCDCIKSGLLAAAKNQQSPHETIKYESTIASIRLDQIDKDHIPPKTGQFCAFENHHMIRSMSEHKNGCVIYNLEIIADIKSLIEKNANIIVKGILTETGHFILDEIKTLMKREDIQADYFIRYTYSSLGKSYTDEVLEDYHKFSMYFLRKTVDVHLCCRATVI